MTGKHRAPDPEEIKRRSRKAWITPGKRPKLTKSDTDAAPAPNSRVRK